MNCAGCPMQDDDHVADAAPDVIERAQKYGLTTRQFMFAREYLVDLNGRDAALRAGYCRESQCEKAARVRGSRLLRTPAVAQAINDMLAETTGVTKTRIVDELAQIGFANMLDYLVIQPDGSTVVDLSNVTREQATAIAEVTTDTFMSGKGEDAREVKRVRIKLADKQPAIDKLIRLLGVYRDKLALTDPDGGPIVVTVIKGLADT